MKVTFKDAAPKIVNGELKKLVDLCKGNEELLARHEIYCSQVIENFKAIEGFKPQGLS